MILEKETLNDLKENYEKVRKLIDEDSKHDPEAEPYLSKYAARAILVHMNHVLLNFIEKFEDRPQKFKILAMQGVVLYTIGVINMDTEEITESEKVLTQAENLLKEHQHKPESVITLMSIYNNLAILWSNREEIDKTEQYLKQAKELYDSYKCKDVPPYDMSQLFTEFEEQSNGNGELALEKAYTLTLYYLAQINGVKKNNLKSALYCHITLKRQLQYNDYDPIDWSLNSATLAQFFAEIGGFKQARGHLAAASIILKKATGDDERIKHRMADVARCWAKYCLLLMSASKDRLMNEDEQLAAAITDMSNLNLDEDNVITKDDLINLNFPGLELSEYEEKVTDKYLLTFFDAREVFLACQSWLTEAKCYYSLDSLASDYIEITQDLSQAYLNLIFFENDDERQAKMHKRRITLLEELLKEINPTYYMQYCRQLWYELGEVYTDLLNLKLDKIKKTDDRPSPQALQKINLLAEGSISNLECFLNSVKEPTKKELPNKLDNELVRPTLTALVLIARNKMKIISPDKQVQLNNVKSSQSAYNTVTDYCKRDEYAANLMKEELSLCREMTSMLPLKIKKLESELCHT